MNDRGDDTPWIVAGLMLIATIHWLIYLNVNVIPLGMVNALVP